MLSSYEGYNVTFVDNYSEVEGTGIFLAGISNVKWHECNFINNTISGAGSGGAIYADQESSIDLKSCKFESNSCEGRGAAISVNNCKTSGLKIEDSIFAKNFGSGTIYIL